jgi:hypothetical protein
VPTLILSNRFSEDSQLLWRTASQLGWNVERLVGWRVPDELRSVVEPVIYVEALMAPVVAEAFGLTFLEPPDDWLPRLPAEFRRREISVSTLAAARNMTEPRFVKPPNDKSFAARVYRGEELPREFDDNMTVLVAEVVSWEKEFRCFLLDGIVRTSSVYLRDGELQRDRDYAATEAELTQVRQFVSAVASDPRVSLPRAVVIDVGVIRDRGWAVVELNSAWGAGIYGCDPVAVLDILRHASLRNTNSTLPAASIERVP